MSTAQPASPRRHIEITTEIPGPQSRALYERRARAVPRGVPHTTPIAVARAEGAIVTDADGNRLIDFAGGIGTLNIGQRNPAVLSAIRDQLDRYLHVCFPVLGYEPYVALAERMNALAPGAHEKRTFFVNSGAEAVENAVKVARAYTKRQAVICFEHGFHGRTQLAMTLTSKVSPYKRGFGPFAPEVYRLPYPYCYRCPHDRSDNRDDRCCLSDRARFEETLAAIVDPSSVAAIVIELEIGEGGFIPAPREYIEMLSSFARDHGIVFVADEVQTGFGRTGRMFASEHYNLIPDVIITAKSLGGGLPLAAITGRAEIMDAAQPGGLGGTFGGNPVACAAALAVIDVMEKDDIAARAAAQGERVRRRFLAWAERHRCIGDVRGLGAMLAMEFVKDHASKTPDKEIASRFIDASLARGVILLGAGTLGNVVRLLAPLNTADDVIDEGLDAMQEALAAVVSG